MHPLGPDPVLDDPFNGLLCLGKGGLDVAAEKGRVLERAFPLLQTAEGGAPRSGNGDGAPSAPVTPQPSAPTSLDALLGGPDAGETPSDDE